MALHKLTITVVNGGKVNSTIFNNTKQTQQNQREQGENILNHNQSVKGKVSQSVSPTMMFAVSSGISIAKQTAKQAISYFISDIGRRSGDSNYQAIINRRIEQVTDGLSIAQGLVSGIAMGSTLGPHGAIIGGIVGTASSAINLGFKYAERERAYEHELFKENNSQAYNMARANYTVQTGRVR